MYKSHCKDNCTNESLKMSMVPLPCQECQLNPNGCIRSESIEWLLDLKDKIPIWSRLNEINTCGFKRKLPMSMTKSYDIEISERLWSLWSHKCKHNNIQGQSKSKHKYYMATTVLALCAARVIRLNIWNSRLMDCIFKNGRKFYKKSLKKSCCSHKEFQLENLDTNCCLEGIPFRVCIKTVQQGCLYSIPLKCQPNLAYSLIKFFRHYQFGLLECNKRILGLGFIDGPSGGYFMYDAQSMQQPLLPKDVSANYLLRTNHLQVLLYCLIASLNVPYMQAVFCLHHVDISVVETKLAKIESDPCKRSLLKCKHILPKEYWKTPSLKSYCSKTNSCDKIPSSKCLNSHKKPVEEKFNKPKYRRKIHNITKEEVENSLIKPLVDVDRKSDEDLKLKKDFVRMICSETVVNLTPTEKAQRLSKDFVTNLVDVLVLGLKTCLKLNKI